MPEKKEERRGLRRWQSRARAALVDLHKSLRLFLPVKDLLNSVMLRRKQRDARRRNTDAPPRGG